MLPDSSAKQQQGKIHICHPRQISGHGGLFQGIRILFQVLIPMVTGPFIGVAVIRNTGMTYEELGTVKQVPTAEIFLAAAVVLVLLVVPVKLLKKREAAKGAN